MPPGDPTSTLFIYHPEPPPPEPQVQKAPVNHIVAHTPVVETPVTVETTPIDPQVEPNKTNAPPAPPVISQASGGTSSSSASAPPYIKASWARFPDSMALSTYYPVRALDNEIEGVASVECTVLDKAGHVSCVALSESPGNYGFGKATVKMVQDKGRIDVAKGNVAMGAKLQATIKWTLGG
ncbi:MAG: energy transducer TonB [Asticcacaulis sp.]